MKQQCSATPLTRRKKLLRKIQAVAKCNHQTREGIAQYNKWKYQRILYLILLLIV
jgi:hypothetical protein